MLNNNKRGLSPLIATILLIGFAVVIVTIVIVWGTSYVKEVQEKEGSLAQGRLMCITDVRINVLNVQVIDISTIDVTVANIGNKIGGFVFRIQGNTGTEIVTVNEAFEQAETKTLEVPYDSTESGDISGGSIDVIPRIGIGGGMYEACSDQLVKFNLN